MALGDLVSSLAADPATQQGGYLDPETLKRKQAIAEALIKQGSDYSPVQHWTQGLARVASALNGSLQERRVESERKRGQQEAAGIWGQLLGGQSPAPVAAPSQAMTTADAGGGPVAAPENLLPFYQKAESETGIPASLLMAQHKQESGFNPNATGKAGEIGLGQIMPSTARDPGFGVASVDPATLRDPETNIMFAARYMAARAKAQGVTDWGNPAAALRAYNGGGDPNYVKNVMRYMPQDGARPTQVASSDGQQAMAFAAPQMATEDRFSDAPVPPARPDDIGLPRSVGPATSAPGTVEPKDEPAAATPGQNRPSAAVAPSLQQQPPNPQVQAAMRVLANPYASPAMQQVASAIVSNSLKRADYSSPYKDEFGNVVQRNAQSGEIKILNAAKEDSSPSAVKEYEYARKNGFGGSFSEWKQQGGANGGSPSTVQEYNFYADQTRKAGQEPLSFLDYQKQKALKFANFDEGAQSELVDSLAQRLVKGDTTWKSGLARDPGLIRAVEVRAAQLGKGMEGGYNADTILQNRANQSGRVQEQATLGRSTANNTLYGNAAAATIDTAIQASRAVPRTDWVPVNRLIQGGEAIASDPKLAAFRTALMTTVNDYAKATTPAGTPTDSQRAHAYEVLNTAVGPEGVEAVLRMMHREIANTHRAIELTKKQLQSGHGGDLPELTAPPADPSVPGSQGVGVWDAIKNAAGFGNKPVHVASPEEARKLAPGTVFTTPDGRTFTR